MAEIIEFELEHDLDYDEAVECVYDMLDEYYENDDFDDLEWDEEEEEAYLGNEAMEVYVTVDDGYLEVYAEIYDEDMDPYRIERDLRKDIAEFFEIDDRPRRRRGGGAPRRKSTGRGRRSAREEEPERPSRKKKKKGGNWDMDEPAPKRDVAKSDDKAPEKPEEEKSGSSWWIWLLVIAAIAAAAFFVMNK